MSEHLSSQRISQWMMGDRAPEEERHVLACAECAAEVARLEAALAGFRSSVRHWSDLEGALAARHASRRLRWRPARWALAGLTLLLVATVPIYRSTRSSRTVGMAPSDALLLEQVDTEVSRSVPRPMEPLLKLAGKDNHELTPRK